MTEQTAWCPLCEITTRRTVLLGDAPPVVLDHFCSQDGQALLSVVEGCARCGYWRREGWLAGIAPCGHLADIFPNEEPLRVEVMAQRRAQLKRNADWWVAKALKEAP